jgi:hypothetical protein
MRSRIVALAAGLLLVVPATVRADEFDPVSFGIHAGTLGYGVTFERPLLFNASVRIETGLLSVSDERTYDGNPYTSTFHHADVLLAGDWRPSGGRLRLSAGLLFGDDRRTLVARNNGGMYLLNGDSYAPGATGTIAGQVSFNHPSLYAGFGTGTGLLRGLSLSFDVGAVLRNGTTTMTATGPLAGNPVFQRDLNAVGAQLQTRYIEPVIGIGLVFRP